jgi:hypothetical protein
MRRISVGVAAVGTALVLSGCTTGAGTATATQPAATATSTSAPQPSVAAQTALTDQESCEAFSDVTTILFNASTGLRENRMTAQEYGGWLVLATRVLDRIPTTGEGAVSDAVASFKAAAPAIPINEIPVGPPDTAIGSREWYNAAPIGDACAAAGYELSTQAFTGG